MTATEPDTGTRLRGGVGDSPLRPDGVPKVTGEFAYSSDLWVDGMLWGATARSPHPRARIRGIDLTAARAVRGVRDIVTAFDGTVAVVPSPLGGAAFRVTVALAKETPQ